jgi:hypothetical protein
LKGHYFGLRRSVQCCKIRLAPIAEFVAISNVHGDTVVCFDQLVGQDLERKMYLVV